MITAGAFLFPNSTGSRKVKHVPLGALPRRRQMVFGYLSELVSRI